MNSENLDSNDVNSRTNGALPIVAIGASAGGLEAITELLKYLPQDTGMAFIYVQHLSPDHKSILTSLLSRATLMRVQEVTDKIRLEPNKLYVIPRDKEIELADGHLNLLARPKEAALHLPINTLFSSLADQQKENAIGIILSGSAHDGTIGLSAIKEAGGLTFAQDESAKFKSMPASAIEAGAVDFILSPREIALELAGWSKHNYRKEPSDRAHEIENDDPLLKEVLQLVQNETGVDFSLYKMNTIKRRILRRMLLCKTDTLDEYAKLIAHKKDETTVLYNDLLIHVTDFFRDTDTHQYLKKTLFPRLLKGKTAKESLRIWIPACSTGEEAYSIAISILEIQATTDTHIPVQIFATDLSEQAIAKARLGEYSIDKLASVSQKRLQTYYSKSGSSYRINKAVRDMCVFASHNILGDPPFSRVDFISCCNLLIYLDTAAQKKAISTFHYALNQGGYLMLGKSETIGTSLQLFKPINNKLKIYSRKNTAGTRMLPELVPRVHTRSAKINGAALPAKRTAANASGYNVQKSTLSASIDAVLLSHYMPPSVVINYELEIIEFRGSTDIYLSHAPGKASLNILKIARPEIAIELRSAIQKAIKTQEDTHKTGIEVKIDTLIRSVSIDITHLKIENEEPLLLVLFKEQQQVEILAKGSTPAKISDIKDREILRLSQELATAHAEMLSFCQEQEAFNEELQSANEEVVSSNEELQSVNEELETSKEEIESTNEELITTNQELQTRNELLLESYDYSEAITATIHEPMIILDKQFFVKSANKSFLKKFGFNEQETIGSAIYELGNKQFDIPHLRELLENIIPKDTHYDDFEITHTFPGLGERTMLLNANRIVQKNHNEQFILLAFNDITERIAAIFKEKERLKKDNLQRKDQNTKLEKAVKNRTKQLDRANEALLEKNKELEKKNKELQAFAYVSSHDLQEPLRRIQIFASRLLDKDIKTLSDDGKNSFARIQVAAGRMRELIDNLLAFSRVNTSARVFENTDLKTLTEEVIDDLKVAIDEKQARIDTKVRCKIPVIPFQLRQLLSNLLSNALKFSNADVKPSVTIKAKISLGSSLNNNKLSPKRRYCHLVIQDNGIGFDPEFNERIFEVFEKLHGNEIYTGTGIGLAIVKKIVENHNGLITASGVLNKGARFDIYLPAWKTHTI